MPARDRYIVAEMTLNHPEADGVFLDSGGTTESVTRSFAGPVRAISLRITSSGIAPPRGATWVRVDVKGPLATDHDVKYILYEGYVYVQHFGFSSGSLPIEAGDVLRVLTVNSAAQHKVIARLILAEEDGSTPNWSQAPDPVTHGNIRTVTGTNPVAGAEVAETVPTNRRWKLLSFSVVLVAAGVANRRTNLAIDDGTTANRRYVGFAGTDQTDGQTRTHLFQIHQGGNVVNPVDIQLVDTDTVQVHPVLSPEAVENLTGGYRIRTVTTGLQVGDNYAAPIFHVEEWMEPA